MSAGNVPPLPKKPNAVFHHPMGFELYSGLSMDLHAMKYAESVMSQRDELLAALREIVGQHGQWNNGMWAANIASAAIAKATGPTT